MADVRPNTVSFGVGPVDLDVEMAREHGWSDALINKVAFAIAAISREASYEVALTKGYTYKCLVCECWTVQPPAPCHLCEPAPRVFKPTPPAGDEARSRAAFYGALYAHGLTSIEVCANCSKHISRHYGGTEYRCDPKP